MPLRRPASACAAFLLGLAACSVPTFDLEGKACDPTHPCLAGYRCEEGRCLLGEGPAADAGASGRDAGPPDSGPDAGRVECEGSQTQRCGPETEIGECRRGQQRCGPEGLWLPCEEMVWPAVEVCDGKDNDCNSSIDEGMDEDQDGWGVADHVCRNGKGDCDDTVKTVYPGSNSGLRRILGKPGAADWPALFALGEKDGFRFSYRGGHGLAARIHVRRVLPGGALSTADQLPDEAEDLRSLTVGRNYVSWVAGQTGPARAAGLYGAVPGPFLALGDARSVAQVEVGQLLKPKTLVALGGVPPTHLTLHLLEPGKPVGPSRAFPPPGVSPVGHPSFGRLGSRPVLYFQSGQGLAGAVVGESGWPEEVTTLSIIDAPGIPVQPAGGPDVVAFKLDCSGGTCPDKVPSRIALARIGGSGSPEVTGLVTFDVAGEPEVDDPAVVYLGEDRARPDVDRYRVGWFEADFLAGTYAYRTATVDWNRVAGAWQAPAFEEAFRASGFTTVSGTLASQATELGAQPGTRLTAFAATDVGSDIFFRLECPAP